MYKDLLPVTFVTLSKARALRARSIQRFLSERRNSCFQDGAVSSAWLVLLSLGNGAFGLEI